MDNKESVKSQGFSLGEKADAQQDVKSLWDRWDKARQEEDPSDLVKGYSLVGVGLIIAGALFQSLGYGFARDVIAPSLMLVGALLVGVRKFRALWLKRSVDS